MYKLIKYNTKLIFSYNAIAAFLFVCMSPVFFQIKDMEFSDLAKMGELYLPLSGIILFISLGNLEVHKYTWEFVYMRQIPYVNICAGRLISVMIFNAILILVPVTYAYTKSDYIRFFDGYCGFVVTAWFLGLLGLLTAEVFRDYKVAYVVTLAYYFVATSSKQIFKGFQVFGYIHGSMNSKNGVFACCLVMAALYLFVVKIKCKHGIV